MRLATEDDNRNGSVILKKAGLSKYLDNYKEWLTPFSYNQGYQNDYLPYAPETVYDQLFDSIGDDRHHQYLFLKAIVEQISRLNRHDYSEDTFNRYLALLGYKITRSTSSETNGYTLQMTEMFALPDGSDYSRFELLAEKASTGSFAFYEEAIATFREGSYGGCVADCRKFLEQIITAKTGESNVGRAIFVFCGEGFNDGTTKVSDQNQAFNYWAIKHDKVYRFMRIYTLYNSLCGFGSHPDVTPDMNDALWLLHETQSSIYWICERP